MYKISQAPQASWNPDDDHFYMVFFLPRMSAEDQNIDKKIFHDIVLNHFRKYKVEISNAIDKPFPFLEILRDREFISNKVYDVSEVYYVTITY